MREISTLARWLREIRRRSRPAISSPPEALSPRDPAPAHGEPAGALNWSSRTVCPADDRSQRIVRLGRAFLFYFLIIFTIRFGALNILNRHGELMDFGSFVASGRAAVAGLNPYGIYPLTYHYADNGFEFDAVNRNPPISALLFQVFAPWDPQAAFTVWYAVSLVLYGCAVYLLARSFPHRRTPLRLVWSFSVAGLWSMLGLGQIYAPLILITTIAWLLLRRGHQWLPGGLIGVVVAIKPMFLVLPALCLLAGAWTVTFAALLVGVCLSVAPVLWYGPGIYGQWLAVLSNQIGLNAPTNGSLLGLMSRAGIPWLGIVLSAAVLVGLAVLVWRRRPSIIQTVDLALIASLIASPEAWTGYTLFLLPPLWSRRWPLALTIAATLLCVPDALVLTLARLSPVSYVTFSYLNNWALLLVLGALAREVIAPRLRSQGRGAAFQSSSSTRPGTFERVTVHDCGERGEDAERSPVPVGSSEQIPEQLARNTTGQPEEGSCERKT